MLETILYLKIKHKEHKERKTMFQVGSSSHSFTRSSPSFASNLNNNNNNNNNHRPCIPHLRVDDEESVLRKFDVGRKIGQVMPNNSDYLNQLSFKPN